MSASGPIADMLPFEIKADCAEFRSQARTSALY